MFCFFIIQQQQSGTHRGGVVLGRKQHKTQILFLTIIQVKEKEISLVATEFRTVLLCRDGWNHQEASFCIFTCFRRFAMERSSVWWCFTDQAHVLSWASPVQISKCSCSPYRFLQWARRERIERGEVEDMPWVYRLQSSQATYSSTLVLLRAHCLQPLRTASAPFQTDQKKRAKE